MAWQVLWKRSFLAGCAVWLMWAATARAAAETYEVDKVHSSVLFRVKHLGVSYFYGRFTDVSGKFTFDDADPAKSSFTVEVKTESVRTDNEKRDQHLKSPDFFNAKQFPVMTFVSKQVKSTAKDKFEVTGDLTLHGVTKPLTVQLERTGSGAGREGGQLAGVETTFTIKRSDFGMGFMLEGLSDEVRVTVSLEGGRK